jgi:hypothetical protein
MGNSTPHVNADLSASQNGGVSKYAIDWDIDPDRLASVIDRRNAAIYPTAKLPAILKIVCAASVPLNPNIPEH